MQEHKYLKGQHHKPILKDLLLPNVIPKDIKDMENRDLRFECEQQL